MDFRFAAVIAALTASCSGSVDTLGLDGEPAVAFVSPSPDSSFDRVDLDEHGARVATVNLDLEVAGITYVELVARGESLMVVEADSKQLSVSATIPYNGTVEIEARGLDADDAVTASATIGLSIDDPDFTCAEWMDFFGVEFSDGPVTQGIPEPVTATLPIAGMPYRYVSDQTPRETLLADCSLIRALADTAGVLRARDVVEVADIGIYNYRCIGGGTPPNCPNGVSQHAYAKAIDIAGYTLSDGSFYSVNDDWVIDGASEETCSAATEGGKDSFLHEIICEQKARGIWNIVLTPNFNEAHRNHFHVDLTDGGDYTARQMPGH